MKKSEPFKKQVVIEREYNGIKAMLRGGAKQKEVAVAFRRSLTTICSVARSETYEEFRNTVRDQWKKRKGKKNSQAEETEQQKTVDEIEKKTENALRAIFQEVIDLLADMAAKEEEAVAVHVNMRDRIYVAETRLRQIFNGGIK